jgi:hypothetical protein
MPSNGPFYEAGLHVAEILSHQLTKASTGNMQLVWRVKILGLPDGDSYAPHRYQYERSMYWTITEKTVPFILEKLETLGFAGKQFSQLDPSHPNHISLKGQQVDLWCKHEEGQDGGIRERWDISNSGLKREVTSLNAKETRELDALFGKALSGGKAKVKTAKPAVDDSEDFQGVGITDEDIPF